MAATLCGNSTKPAMLTAYIRARSGDLAAAHTQLAAFAEMARLRFVPPYASALIHAGLGDDAACLDALGLGLQVRDVNLCFLPCDPKWSDLRKSSRFQSIVEQCGFTGDPPPGQGPEAARSALQVIFGHPPWLG